MSRGLNDKLRPPGRRVPDGSVIGSSALARPRTSSCQAERSGRPRQDRWPNDLPGEEHPGPGGKRMSPRTPSPLIRPTSRSRSTALPRSTSNVTGRGQRRMPRPLAPVRPGLKSWPGHRCPIRFHKVGAPSAAIVSSSANAGSRVPRYNHGGLSGGRPCVDLIPSERQRWIVQPLLETRAQRGQGTGASLSTGFPGHRMRRTRRRRHARGAGHRSTTHHPGGMVDDDRTDAH